MIRRGLLLVLMTLPACGGIPPVSQYIGRTGPTPPLLPSNALPAPRPAPQDPGASLAAAADALRGQAGQITD